MKMTRTVQIQQMKMKKKTETEAFQKLVKRNFGEIRNKITERKSYIETTKIKTKKTFIFQQRAFLKN